MCVCLCRFDFVLHLKKKEKVNDSNHCNTRTHIRTLSEENKNEKLHKMLIFSKKLKKIQVRMTLMCAKINEFIFNDSDIIS